MLPSHMTAPDAQGAGAELLPPGVVHRAEARFATQSTVFLSTNTAVAGGLLTVRCGTLGPTVE
jgi:hypothetical protein